MTAQELLYQQTRYLKSAADLSQLPDDEGSEVAFIGRSNAGKSSSLNVITGIKGLARTSKTPGRTQMINFFSIDDEKRLVDLPGYGYAKVPLSIKERWMDNVDEFLRTRQCLKGLVVVMDIRHPLKELDQQVIAWAMDCGVPTHILLTKADKLNPNAQRKALREVSDALSHYADAITIQLFSSIDRIGIDEVKSILDHWFAS
ncbi:MAG: YihA family ribosome biogenesis GTP-binding protein [Coxiella sp. RIFCSPHIGHO2_12_FULL_42_15]|nr:MAG: YihA family ribosome biogenesis GTP-binding protein [Coxiella sp. RIFCSPHIGHO2_12_FULL_42_15]